MWRIVSDNWVPVVTAIVLLVIAFGLFVYVQPEPGTLLDHVRNAADRLDHLYASNPDSATKERTILSLVVGTVRQTTITSALSHVSVGLFSAALLILFVEIHLRTKLRTEVERDRRAFGEDVWRAISGRLVPEAIAKEVEGILKQDVCRVGVRYRVTLLTDPYTDIPAGYIVVRRAVLYKLRNLTGQALTHVVQSIIAAPERTVRDELGNQITLPRQRHFTVDGREILISERTTIEHPVHLSSSSDPQCEIYIVGEEVREVSDRTYYGMLTPADGLEIDIRNEVRNLVRITSVRFGHRGELTPRADGTYFVEGGILPGQGFVISWTNVTPGNGAN